MDRLYGYRGGNQEAPLDGARKRFERHCLPAAMRTDCLVPVPKEYQKPMPWPQSRDEVGNVFLSDSVFYLLDSVLRRLVSFFVCLLVDIANDLLLLALFTSPHV